MDKIDKDQTSDGDLMLEALKDAKAGKEIADNLHAAAEFCEDIDFAEVAVKNGQAVGVLASTDSLGLFEPLPFVVPFSCDDFTKN